ncbi:hypothetical protein RF11_08388 [Thelohanellus kitauei]|uniref:Uncharacterized protein n=1 Tax=Thelohanellus kitauei TaxID=669202 RepID=A0A0C2JE72_THEKT|nr:hypothetical protein RF11_08388 [Thelohanellus kitauei]
MSLRMISIKICEKYSIQIDKTTIYDCVDAMHFSLKSVAFIPEKRNDPTLSLSDKQIYIRDQRVEYLEPYTPLLNLIGNMFSKWKNLVKRSNCTNEEQILSCMDNGIIEIFVSDCDGWDRNMKSFIRQSLND